MIHRIVPQQRIIQVNMSIMLRVVVQLPSRVWLFATPWTAAHQASLSLIICWSLPKFISIASVMSSSQLILWHQTWNIRSMNQGKLDVVKQEMVRININILAISELKWTGMGKQFRWSLYLLLWARIPYKKWSSPHNQQESKMQLGYNLKNDRMLMVRTL